MTEVSWSRCGGEDCVRLTGLAPQAEVRVLPSAAAALGDAQPMAGRLVREGRDTCFVPRFAFADGTTYTVAVDGAVAAILSRPRPGRPATTRVLGIYPTAAEVPCNLLRFYVWFSAPMSEGHAASHIRVVSEAGHLMAGVLLAHENELWDGDRRRLTVLLDPARIKRGLPGHDQAGYPLRPGERFRLVVGDGFTDAVRAPLRAAAERRYLVGDAERRRVEPGTWVLTAPASRTREPLGLAFDRPLDHGLLARCLRITGPDGRPVEGRPEPGPQERSWRLVPRQAWAPGSHRLVIDPILEDLAGNSLRRVFDRDLTSAQDEPGPARPVTVPFCPR